MDGRELIGKLKDKFGLESDGDLADQLGITQQTLINWKNAKKGVQPTHVANVIYKAVQTGMGGMNGQKLVDKLKEKLDLESDGDLADQLGITQQTLINWKNAKKGVQPTHVANVIYKALQEGMNGKELVDRLKGKLGVESDSNLADLLGVTQQTLIRWKNEKPGVQPKHVANAIHKAIRTAEKTAHIEAISPIVEYFRLEPYRSARNSRYQLFPTKSRDGFHPLNDGLREVLEAVHGIYVFHDTRGRALYVGKAKQQSLWQEMNLAFNRERETQKVYRVEHPRRRQKFVSAAEKLRQPVSLKVPLYELAAYLSVYKVYPDMIDGVEALIIRAFANDLLNVKMERFPNAG